MNKMIKPVLIASILLLNLIVIESQDTVDMAIESRYMADTLYNNENNYIQAAITNVPKGYLSADIDVAISPSIRAEGFNLPINYGLNSSIDSERHYTRGFKPINIPPGKYFLKVSFSYENTNIIDTNPSNHSFTKEIIVKESAFSYPASTIQLSVPDTLHSLQEFTLTDAIVFKHNFPEDHEYMGIEYLISSDSTGTGYKFRTHLI